MNRLQKKCFIVSAGLHLSLVLTLMVGPAFIAREKQPQPITLLMVDPDLITDGQSKGGNANTQPPPLPPNPNPPQPPKVEPKRSEPVPAKVEPPTVAKQNPDSLEVSKTPKVNTKLIVRNQPKDTSKTAKSPNSNTSESTQKIREALTGIKTGLSSSTPIDINPGPGGGGPVSGNYRDLVGSKYWAAWTLPTSTERENAVVEAMVTISRDGRVTIARITKPSGDPQVDASVRRTLDRVTFIAPFPEGSSDLERTYPLSFDLKMKRLEG